MTTPPAQLDDHPQNDYQRRITMRMVRIGIAIFGLLLPYLMCLPGALSRPTGSTLLKTMLTPSGMLFICGLSAANWFPILLGTFIFRWPRSAIVAAAIGFAFPVYGHIALGFSTDAQTPIGYLFVPIYATPLVILGWIAGLALDLHRRRENTSREK